MKLSNVDSKAKEAHNFILDQQLLREIQTRSGAFSKKLSHSVSKETKYINKALINIYDPMRVEDTLMTMFEDYNAKVNRSVLRAGFLTSKPPSCLQRPRS